MVAILNCLNQFEIYAVLYFPLGQNSWDILDQFQESLEDLALSLGANPIIFIGADFNIDFDRIDERLHDKSTFIRVTRLFNDFALIDLFRFKYKSKVEYPGYTFYPTQLGSKIRLFNHFKADMTLLGDSYPLQFSEAKIVDKSEVFFWP